MKKLSIFVLCTFLSACYCQTRQNCPTKQAFSAVTSTPETTTQQTNLPAVQTAASASKSALATQGKMATVPEAMPTAVATSQTVAVLATPDNEKAEEKGFTAEQAQVLIAQARARQTLSTPPADKLSFKKEDTIPLQGRLLHPLAYEPILPDNTHAPWSNESLKYGLYYSFIKAGTAYIKTRGLVSKNGKTAYLIQTTAFSATVIDSVYKVRDINYSWLDVDSLHSLGYSQSLREGNYKRDEWVTFDDENGRFYGQVQKKEEPKIIADELKQQVLDMLTSLYYVRAKPLAVGQDVTFDIINRETQYPLVVKVLGKETVKTAAGKFNCWVVEPQFRGEGIFVAKGKSLKVWLTDDQYRMPVKMAVEVFIGSVTAELLAYERN